MNIKISKTHILWGSRALCVNMAQSRAYLPFPAALVRDSQGGPRTHSGSHSYMHTYLPYITQIHTHRSVTQYTSHMHTCRINHMYTCKITCTDAHAHTQNHMHTCRSLAHMQNHMPTCRTTCIMQNHMYTHRITCTHAESHAHMKNHMPTHRITCRHSESHAHAESYTHMHS